jgi:hypothetical protein
MNWIIFIAIAVIGFMAERYEQKFKSGLRIKKKK